MSGMRRRDFVTLLAGTVAVPSILWPLAVGAQPDRMRRIGVLMSLTKEDPEDQRRRALLEQGLQQLGWTQGRNVVIDYRWFAGEPARAQALAKELVDLKPDLIVTASTPGLVAAGKETRTIPIVFVAVSDPVGQGLVTSLARPGGNATGFSYFEFPVVGKVLETLKQMAPGVVRVALLFNPDTLSYIPFLRSLDALAPSVGAQLIKAPVRNGSEIEAAIAAAAREPGGGLLVLPDAFTNVHRDLIVGSAARHRLPAAYTLRFFATAGGLMSYGIDMADLYRRAVPYMDRILKGAKPAELPVQQPTKFEFVLNLKAARALGLDVPPMLVAQADEVIE
jgi:putative tryptophan/tyrosine transport system substrate-binding protein